MRYAMLAFVLTLAGCQADRHSGAGFRLPPGASAERGKAMFVSNDCGRCHDVSGVELPRPVNSEPVRVVLGGTVAVAKTDGYLTTSIVYPSHDLARYPQAEITLGGQSRMPAVFGEKLTVREVADLVEFLQSRYELRQPPPYAN